jgi:hypothetical protein
MEKGLMLVCLLLLVSCDSEETVPARTYRMGFQNSAPRFDNLDLFLESLAIWTTRADAAIISTEVPWEEFLAGEKPVDYVVNNYKGLAEYYRSKNLVLWVYIDPQNGLDRASDALELVDAGKSIAQPEMQEIYRRFVVVMDSVLKPDHMGLALETNLIRTASVSAIYNGVKQAANDAAAELTARNTKAKLSVSVQVDHAWGKLIGGTYEGVERDFEDFPFMEEVGLSSYPYFGFDKPSDIPLDYYSRLLNGRDISVFVTEGGWTSQSVSSPDRTLVSNNQRQKEYIDYHQKLLDNVQARAWFQLTFTDIDLNSLPPDVPEIIGYFAYLGLVDMDFTAKPALDAWDEIFKRELR